MNQGFVVNDEKVLKVFGNHQIGAISYNEQQSIVVEEGIVDLDHGSRFEGLILAENKFQSILQSLAIISSKIRFFQSHPLME